MSHELILKTLVVSHAGVVSPIPLSDDFDRVLDEQRVCGDELADGVVAALVARDELGRVDGFIRAQEASEAAAFCRDCPELAAFFQTTNELPVWADPDLIDQASQLFERFGPLVLTQLLFRSLPLCYAAYPGVKVVHAGGKMGSNFRRRSLETAQMVVDVLSPGGLRRGGFAVLTLQKVRLIHAYLRHRLRDDASLAEMKVIINQEDQVGTLMAFSIVVLDGLERMGIDLSEAEQTAYLHVWAVAGHILGVDPRLRPTDANTARKLQSRIEARNHRASDEARELTAEILNLGREIIPGRFLDGLPASAMRLLIGDELATALGVPLAKHTTRLLRVLRVVFAVFDDIADAVPLLRGPFQRIGIRLTNGLLRMEGGGLRRHMFLLSDHLQIAWKIRSEHRKQPARWRRFLQGFFARGNTRGARPWKVFGFAVNIPYAWYPFVTRFSADGGVIGADFFRRLAEEVGADAARRITRGGILDRFADLDDGEFNPAAVAPQVADFYERTSAYALRVRARPSFWLRWLLTSFLGRYFRAIRQFNLPSGDEYVAIDSWVELIDLNDDRVPDHRAWVRIVPTESAPLQIGAYRAFRIPGDLWHIAAVLPLPSGNLTAVFAISNDGSDGMVLSTRDPRSTLAGIYFINPGERTFRWRPSLLTSESFHLRVQADGTIAVHSKARLFGIPAIQLDYLIEEKRTTHGARQRYAEALTAAAQFSEAQRARALQAAP